MRLSEDKIKEGILHPDQEVRDIAVRYFSESFSPDQSVMPLVIQAIETYGWQDAIPSYSLREGLAQTDETLLWILGELTREEDARDEAWSRYRWGLLDLLRQADIHLLARHQSRITDTDGIEFGVREDITERICLLSADSDRCWAELGEWCQKEQKKSYVNEVNLNEPSRLVEAIARQGERYAGRVLSLLEEEVEDYQDHPMGWMEPLIVQLAGEMLLGTAVPLIVRKLHEEGDLLHEKCERALWKIGTDTVVEEVCRDYCAADWSYRLTGAAVLERIRTDLAVTKCLELLSQEEDQNIKVWLGRAVVQQLSFDGVEPIRKFIHEGPLDPEMRELRKDFLAACTLMEVGFSEMEQWKKDTERDVAEKKRFYRERFSGRAEYVDEQNDEEFEDYDEEPMTPPDTIARQQRTGRNDPCPCGSGKKFKKCCMKKQKSDLLLE